MDIEQWTEDYIKSKQLAWSRSSIKNERSRLHKHGANVLIDPNGVYTALKTTMTDHSIKTTFVRLGKFYEWLVENDKIPAAKNPWKAFLSSNARVFKYCYQVEHVKMGFEEAREKILTMEEPYQSAALQLLEGGLRYCELRTFDGEKVIGKGSKPRLVFLRDALKSFRYMGSYSALYIRIKATGLKPHTLRKLCATKLSRHPDVKDQDICKIFGWSSIETSIKYRQPMNDDKLGDLLKTVIDKT